jgi:hypothetical protein
MLVFLIPIHFIQLLMQPCRAEANDSVIETACLTIEANGLIIKTTATAVQSPNSVVQTTVPVVETNGLAVKANVSATRSTGSGVQSTAPAVKANGLIIETIASTIEALRKIVSNTKQQPQLR